MKRTLRPLAEIVANPSGFDSMKNYSGSVPEAEWLNVLTRSRDADILTESNFDCALDQLGGESDSVEIFRFGHWACGWWESLAVRKGSESEIKALEITEKLDSYPVLDDQDFSEREMQEANQVWSNCYSVKDRVEYIRNNRSQFEFWNLKEVFAVVRGEYFNGYACELIS